MLLALPQVGRGAGVEGGGEQSIFSPRNEILFNFKHHFPFHAPLHVMCGRCSQMLS